uniref:p9 n=1 Tax=Fig closterovirus 2 TaxID=2809011 RepID=A0A8A0XWE2_9CLOS|nr:p9 [Fig closterovirus 2]
MCYARIELKDSICVPNMKGNRRDSRFLKVEHRGVRLYESRAMRVRNRSTPMSQSFQSFREGRSTVLRLLCTLNFYSSEIQI